MRKARVLLILLLLAFGAVAFYGLRSGWFGPGGLELGSSDRPIPWERTETWKSCRRRAETDFRHRSRRA